MVVAGLVALGACGGGGDGDDGADDGPRTVQPGAPGEEGRELSDEEAAAIDVPAHTPADTAFVQGMIAVHQGRHGQRLLVLAERVRVSQEDEIARLETWLTDRGEDVPAADAHRHHDPMPGMATPEQLAQLDAARDAAFDRLFLELMIAHHQGAVTMVEQLYGSGGGLEPVADDLARDIEADQTIEIGRMQELLATLP